MELHTRKDTFCEYTYYLESDGRKVYHGEYKYWYRDGQIWEHTFLINGKRHGEYRRWRLDGHLLDCIFFIHDILIPELNFNSPEEKFLFQLEHPEFRFIEN